MAKLELSEAVKALIAEEVDVIFDKSTNSSTDTEKHRSKRDCAVKDVGYNVARNLTSLAEQGFGTCFSSYSSCGFVEDELVPIRNKAVRAALLEHGIETDEDGDFVCFVDDEHRVLFESRIPDKYLLQQLTEAKGRVESLDKTIKESSTHREEASAQVADMCKVLGKRPWFKEVLDSKRARTEDAGGVGDADA